MITWKPVHIYMQGSPRTRNESGETRRVRSMCPPRGSVRAIGVFESVRREYSPEFFLRLPGRIELEHVHGSTVGD